MNLMKQNEHCNLHVKDKKLTKILENSHSIKIVVVDYYGIERKLLKLTYYSLVFIGVKSGKTSRRPVKAILSQVCNYTARETFTLVNNKSFSFS